MTELLCFDVVINPENTCTAFPSFFFVNSRVFFRVLFSSTDSVFFGVNIRCWAITNQYLSGLIRKRIGHGHAITKPSGNIRMT